jgi:L-ascorbate metabolism protein UlaG (beta-lactamase superfamily)
MEITWHGELCFTIKGKNTIVVIDPYADGKHKLENVKADSVLLTNNYDEDKKLVSGAEDAMQINLPGEYEVSGAAIVAISAYTKEREEGDSAKGRIVIFSFMVDDVRFCHLGMLGEELDDEMLDKIGDVDVLMISSGGDKSVEPKKTREFIEKIESRVVIPMNYSGDEIDPMLKEMGISEPEQMESFEIKAKSQLPEDKTDVVLLNVSP